MPVKLPRYKGRLDKTPEQLSLESYQWYVNGWGFGYSDTAVGGARGFGYGIGYHYTNRDVHPSYPTDLIVVGENDAL